MYVLYGALAVDYMLDIGVLELMRYCRSSRTRGGGATIVLIHVAGILKILVDNGIRDVALEIVFEHCAGECYDSSTSSPDLSNNSFKQFMLLCSPSTCWKHR